MRASLRHHLENAFRRGRFSVLARGALRAAQLRAGFSPSGPLLATFALTWRCPLRCAMCDLPARAGAEIPDEEIPRWIDAIASLRPLGLGFTGGEPLLRHALFPAIERAAARGIVVHLNTSGVGLGAEAARRLVDSGLASVNVSLDHDRGADHDRTRGRSGAQARALEALARLSAARAGSRNTGGAKNRMRIQATMAVSEASLDRVAQVDALARESGADCLTLIPVHDFGAAAGPPRPPPSDSTETLLRLPLENSAAYLRGIVPFLAGEKTPRTCSAPRAGLFVGPDGRAWACTPAATERHAGIATTAEALPALFRSGALRGTVPPSRCSRCWWNCHRELDLALGVLRMPAS